MEKIKVNMSPNPLDVQTIHASQNDNEARQWEFELHNNGELIDTSDVKEQMVFKAYKGGTEQLLPENTSTPTTTPILADIQYPDGLRTDQYFTYRETPTTISNKARIKTIKGNTLAWNQLAEPLKSENYVANNGTVTYNNGVATFTASSAGSSRGLYQRASYRPAVIGHKYLLSALITSGNSNTLKFGFIDTQNQTVAQNTKQRITKIVTTSYTGALTVYFTMSEIDTFSVENIMMIDLTQMGLDSITDPSEFTSLFSLPYYDYNAGTLLSFNGTGLKTVGFNQWDEQWEVGTLDDTTGENRVSTGSIRSVNYIQVLPDTTYYIHVGKGINMRMLFYDSGMNYLGDIINANNDIFTTPANAHYMRFRSYTAYGTTYLNDICINISNTELNGTYEPYTESVLSLPISTYFPNGMKSAGNVYDELTESKAITRIGSLKGSDIQGTVSSAVSTGGFHYVEVTGLGSKASGQGISNMLPIKNDDAWSSTVPCIQIRPTEGSIRIYGAFTTFQEFQTQYASLVIYYELATPTETSFTTASLVTENAEIPLSNNDGVLLGKCTEQLSENPGFIDAKIKLSDADGECYSNKIQLHVERSPQ